MQNSMLNDLRNFMSLSRDEKLEKVREAVDSRVRIITAGLSLKELRALFRGESPTERPNPRYKVHVTSFIAHLRPKFYLKASTHFTHTFRLGYLSTLMFVVETITGLILMIYYVPSPAEAYGSILNLHSNVMFGTLLRELHRLGAELMVIFVWLHLFRTYFTGSYKGERSFTWLTGVFLLIVTVFLSFSGYLLPWDQLAYWAVTIGTSMADKAPAFGAESNLLLRGAPDIGAGGLLRFYLAHVVLLPLVGILILSIHYYKVSREHGISLPAYVEEKELTKDETKNLKARIDFIPDLLTHEIFLACLVFLAMIVYATFFYNAPLETHANPLKTPLDTKAPWYFWWVQGMLKLGDPTLMGAVLPVVFIVILLAIPYVDRNPNRLAKNRPFAVVYGLFWAVALIVLSYMGTPVYGIETPPAVRIVQDLAPEEGIGELRAIPYDQLVPGVYWVGETNTEDMPPAFAAVFEEFSARVQEKVDEGELPQAEAMFYVTNWQPDVKRLKIRIEWLDPDTSAPKDYEHEFFLSRDRRRSE